jgi:hypothetical protein
MVTTVCAEADTDRDADVKARSKAVRNFIILISVSDLFSLGVNDRLD